MYRFSQKKCKKSVGGPLEIWKFSVKLIHAGVMWLALSVLNRIH
jgi:hypothetical protein